MNLNPMLSFLSENNLKAHIAYVKEQRLCHSIQEKSLPEIRGMSAAELCRARIPEGLRRELLPRLFDIELHRLYFESFSDRCCPCPEIKEFYSSEDAFCYELITAARSASHGFVYVTRPHRGAPEIKCTASEGRADYAREPLLALDVSEHAYFLDCGFNKEAYLRGAISRLCLGKLFPERKKVLDTGV